MAIQTELQSQLLASNQMEKMYASKLKTLEEELESLNQQGRSTLAILDSERNQLILTKNNLHNIYHSNPNESVLEDQYSILQQIELDANLGITDDKIFHELGFLRNNENLTSLTFRLDELTDGNTYGHKERLEKERQNLMLKRRYKILKQTVNNSMRKATAQRDLLLSEVESLRELLKQEENG